MTIQRLALVQIRCVLTCVAVLSLGGITAPDAARAGLDGVVLGPTLFAYDFTNDHLVCFSAYAPSVLIRDIPLTGLSAGESLVGIDFRPATGELYAVATSESGDRVVAIDIDTGAVTAVTPGFLASAIPGSYFGIDFSPVVDRLRVVSNLNSNVRLNPTSGVVAGIDSSLEYAAGDLFEGANPDAVHIAYTNSYAGATSTTVFAIDAGTDSLVRVGSVDGTPVSPNSGQLTTIGPLGVSATGSGGFDIDPETGFGWAALRVAGVSQLYSINLATGAATLVGSIGSGGDFDGLAVPEPNASVAALSAALALLGLRRVHG
jgi:hypothetical protein